jgi:hypothetical protein
MQFVTTTKGLNIALTSVETWKLDGEIVHVQTNRGEPHQVHVAVWDEAQHRSFVAVLPAAPETFFLISVVHEDGSMTWDEELVLGWGINFNGYSVAIGSEGVDTGDLAVLLPSGRVVVRGTEWESKDAYVRNPSHD